MDLNTAFTNGYNVGKDIGYNISGRAAEDARLTRETTRAKIDALKAQADLAQQQAQYARDDRLEQEKLKAYEGVMLTSTNAIHNPLLKSQALQNIRQFQQDFGYSTEWAITDALDDDTKDEEQFKARTMLAYTVHGKGTNPLDKQNAEDFQRVQQGMVKMTNTQTGETQYAHIGDLLYMFGGNYGTAYMHSIIQAKKLKEQQEREKAQADLNKTIVDTQVAQNKMINDNLGTQVKISEEQRKNEQYKQAQAMSNHLQNIYQQDPSSVKSISTKDGQFTGLTFNNDNGQQQLSQEELKQNRQDAMNKLATLVQVDNNNKFLRNISTEEQRSIIENYMNARPISKNAAEQKSYDTTHFEPMIQAVEKLYELEAAGVEGATERRQTLESAMSYFDEQFGAGKNTDSKLSQRLAVFNSSIRSGNLIAKDGRGITGILQTALLNSQDFINLPIDSDEFRIAQDALNALINDQMINLGELFNGRLTNKVLANLRPTSQWRSYITNASRVIWLMNRLADRAEQDAKIASPSQAGQARFVAKQLRKAVDNLSANVRLETKINEGKVNDMNILDAKNGSLEKAAQASQSNDTIYFDGKGSVYIIPCKPDKTLDNYKYSMKEFKAAIDKNGKSLNWMTSWLPGVEKKTAWSQFTN